MCNTQYPMITDISKLKPAYNDLIKVDRYILTIEAKFSFYNTGRGNLRLPTPK